MKTTSPVVTFSFIVIYIFLHSFVWVSIHLGMYISTNSVYKDTKGTVLKATKVYLIHVTVLFVRCSYLHACSSLVIGLNFISHFDDRCQEDSQTPVTSSSKTESSKIKRGKSHGMQSIQLLHGALSTTGPVCRYLAICPLIGWYILIKSADFSFI